MKYFKSALILMLLIGLPLGSWYFLKSGLDWRKAKVVKLQQKEVFLKTMDFTNDDKNRLYELMAHRTAVVKREGSLSPDDKSLIDQFEDAYTFMFLSMAGTEAPAEGWNSKSVVRYYKPSSTKSRSEQIGEWDYMLVDTAGYIRQYYQGTDKQVMNILVEDIAVILPRKKEKDIVIKNNSNSN